MGWLFGRQCLPFPPNGVALPPPACFCLLACFVFADPLFCSKDAPFPFSLCFTRSRWRPSSRCALSGSVSRRCERMGPGSTDGRMSLGFALRASRFSFGFASAEKSWFEKVVRSQAAGHNRTLGMLQSFVETSNSSARLYEV